MRGTRTMRPTFASVHEPRNVVGRIPQRRVEGATGPEDLPPEDTAGFGEYSPAP